MPRSKRNILNDFVEKMTDSPRSLIERVTNQEICVSRDIYFYEVRGRPVLRPPPTIIRLSFASCLLQPAFSTLSRSRSLYDRPLMLSTWL